MFGYGYTFPAPVLTSEETRDAANDARIAAILDAEDDINLVQPASSSIGGTVPTLPVPSLQSVDRGRLTTAAHRARKAFPGPVGSLVYNELSTWADLGFRFGGDSTIARLVEAVMAIPDSDLPPAA